MDSLSHNMDWDHFINDGMKVEDLEKLLSMIPGDDSSDLTFLELANRFILEASNMVDSAYPTLDDKALLSKKYQVMASLLKVKAETLKNSF